MKRVMATGVFDILHPGHLFFLKESKKLGEELYVVVARDSTANKRGKTTIFDENTRLSIVSELRVVDHALLGHEGDIYKTVEEIRPDMITLGYDQKFKDDEIINNCRARGISVEVRRIDRNKGSTYQSSTQIREKLLQIIGEKF